MIKNLSKNETEKLRILFWAFQEAQGAILLSEVPAAANNAGAQAAGLGVGDFYRTNADPSVVCIRSA